MTVIIIALFALESVLFMLNWLTYVEGRKYK